MNVQTSEEFIEVIPELNDVGYLPPGVHLASLDEIAARFGQESEIRQAQIVMRSPRVSLRLSYEHPK